MLNVFLRVCDAVAFAHSRGVLHRDIKPDNVMVGDVRRGLPDGLGPRPLIPTAPAERAVSASTSAARRSGVRGTPAFMAPEQAQGRAPRIGERTDVFGLGAVLY